MLGFWIFMLIMCLIIPIIIVPIGKIFEKSPPKNINAIIGYRTAMSMKNMETWIFAHKYSGRLLFILGLLSLPLTIIPMIFIINTSMSLIAVIGSVIMFAVMIFIFLPTIVMTEKALNKYFNKDGTHKSS